MICLIPWGMMKMIHQIYDMELVFPADIQEKKKYKYYIMAPNIERRSREAFLQLQNKNIFENVIIMDYANFHKVSEDDRKEVESIYSDVESTSMIRLQATGDIEAIRLLRKVGMGKDDEIAIDITGFSIPNIYCIMNILKNVVGVSHIDVYYTEPKLYIYEKGYLDSYHVHEERRCAPILGFCNNGKDEKEILTIFLGFDGGLADLVYYKLGEEGKEILQTIAVNGFPSYTSKLKDISLYNNEDLINKIERENVLCTTANNPFETYNLLCQISNKYKDVLLNICTIGAKPMALGACLFAMDYSERVKVTYPFYEKTKFDKMEESGKIWRYGVDFMTK